MIINLIFGPPFFVKEKREEILSSVHCEYSMSFFVAPSYEDLRDPLMSCSLFNSLRVVIVSQFSFSKKMDFLLRMSDCTPNILIIEGEDASDCEKLSDRIKVLEIEHVNCYFLEDPKKKKDVEKFIISQASSMSVNLDKEAISFIADFCCEDYSIVNQELIKLKTLFSDSKITTRDIIEHVVPMAGSKSVLDLYVSLMVGNTSDCISISREIIKESGPEEVFSCIMKLVEICLLFSNFNGDKSRVVESLKKYSKSEGGEKQKAPSDFVIRVAQKIYERIDSQKRARTLFVRTYNHFTGFRIKQNLALASSHIDELMCALSRRY